MEYIGMDVHKRESQVCIVDATGTVVVEARIRTTRERVSALLGGRPRARIVLEASTESEWVAQCLEGHGHEVIVADPTYAPMYAARTRRVKTDRRDARALAEASRVGTYRAAHRLGARRRELRATLAMREALVRTRTRYVALVRALLRREGVGLPSGSAERFGPRFEAAPLPAALRTQLVPLVELLAPLEAALQRVDQTLAAQLAAEPAAGWLQSVRGVGPVTTAAVVAALDTPQRFASAHHAAAYLGLVPREWSSGDRHHRGAITKTGNRRARTMLVQAAWVVWRDRHPDTAPLRAWATRLAQRRGTRIMAVALARRLAGILFALWRDGTRFDPARLTRPAPRATEVAA